MAVGVFCLLVRDAEIDVGFVAMENRVIAKAMVTMGLLQQIARAISLKIKGFCGGIGQIADAAVEVGVAGFIAKAAG